MNVDIGDDDDDNIDNIVVGLFDSIYICIRRPSKRLIEAGQKVHRINFDCYSSSYLMTLHLTSFQWYSIAWCTKINTHKNWYSYSRRKEYKMQSQLNDRQPGHTKEVNSINNEQKK